MRAILTILIFQIIAIHVFSDDFIKKNVIAAYVGIASPISYFAKNEFSRNAGFAKVGSNSGIEYYRYLSKYFAINASMGHSYFLFDESSYLAEYKKVLMKPDGIEVTTGNYHLYMALLGIALKTPVINKFELLILAQMGYSNTFHPNILVTDRDWGVINSIDRDNSISKIGSLTIKFNYHFSEKYGLSFSYNRNTTNPMFDDKSSYEGHFDLPVTYQTFNIGFTKFF